MAFKIAFGITVFLLGVYAHAALGTGSKGAIEDFLTRMGFEDYSRQASASLSQKRFEVITDGREIASDLMSRLGPELRDPTVRSRVIEVTSRMLALKPTFPPSGFPNYVENIRDVDARHAAEINFLIESTRQSIAHATRDTLSDLLVALYGLGSAQKALNDPNLQALSLRVARYVRGLYLDPELGHTRFLGRAMALSLLREAKLSGDVAMPADLRRAARQKGEFLENYTGSAVGIVDQKGNARIVPLESGSVVSNYSGNLEVREIAHSIAPKPLRDGWKSVKQKIMGHYLFSFFLSSEEAIRKKVASGGRLTWGDHVSLWLGDHTSVSNEFVDSGVVDVKIDPETGLKSVWIYHNLPDADRGAVIPVGPEGFTLPGHSSRFGAVTYDPEKVYEYTRRRERMHYPPEEANRWFREEFVPQSIAKMKGHMLKDGTPFSFDFSQREGLPRYEWAQSRESVELPVMTTIEKERERYQPREIPLDPELSLRLGERLAAESAPSAEGDYRALIQDITGFIQSHVLREKRYQFLLGHSSRQPQPESRYVPPQKFDEGAKLVESSLPADQKEIVAQESRAFLERLGFENYSAMAKRSLDQKTYLNELGRKALQENVLRYQMVNSARDVSSWILSEMRGRTRDPESRRRLIELTARFLDLQPIAPPRELPVRIRTLPENEREAALTDYIAKYTRLQIDEHSRKLVSDILDTVYGEARIMDPNERKQLEPKIRELYGQVEKYVDRLYLDPQINQTRFLGRAMVALLDRESLKTQDPALMTELRDSVAERGLELDNFIGDTWRLRTEKGGLEALHVENGSPILNRSYDLESSAIAAAAIPGNEDRAHKMKLMGSLLQIPLAVDETEMKGRLGLADRTRLAMGQNQKFDTGFSHMMFANVLEDPETGIKMTWVLHNYPYFTNDSYGGVDLVGLEHIANQDHYGKLALATYDQQKFRQHARQFVKENPWQEARSIFPAYEIALKGDGHLDHSVVTQRQDWKLKIAKEDFDRLHSIQDPGQFYREWSKRSMDHIRENMMARDGVWFFWLDEGRYYFGGTYCSMLGEIAALQSTGVSLEKDPDRYAGMIKGLAKTVQYVEKRGYIDSQNGGNPALKEAGALPLKERVVAPVGIASQDFVKRLEIVDLPNVSETGKAYSAYSHRRPELSPRVTDAIAPIIEDLGVAAATREISALDRGALEVRFRHDYLYPVALDEGVKGSEILEARKAFLTVPEAESPRRDSPSRLSCLFARLKGVFH